MSGSAAAAALRGVLHEATVAKSHCNAFRAMVTEKAREAPSAARDRRILNLHTLLKGRREYKALFTEYHRGELSVAAAAAKVGFALPKVRSKGKGNPANKKKQSQETEGF